MRSTDPTYRSWAAMIQRCINPNNNRWKSYGGRGITVCERWRRSASKFLEDMGERPNGCTLDRIDNDGDYEPENCRWATPAMQAQNRRIGRRRSTPRAKISAAKRTASPCSMRQIVFRLAAETCVNANTVLSRIQRGWPIEKCYSAADHRCSQLRQAQPVQIITTQAMRQNQPKGKEVNGHV